MLAVPRRTKILAMLGMGSKPNLRQLMRLIDRGVVSGEEVVLAVEEALKLKRVNARIVEAISTALREALAPEIEIIDMPPGSAQVASARRRNGVRP